MRFSIARLLSLATLVSGLASFVFVPGCSQQGEGERCGDDNYGPASSDDCGDGLVCTNKDDLLNGNGANRCCYPNRVTDARCQPSTGTPSDGSGGGTGGGGTTAEAGEGG